MDSYPVLFTHILQDCYTGTRNLFEEWRWNRPLTNTKQCAIQLEPITMTSSRAGWRLKSPASRLLTQPFIQAQIKENIKAPRDWLFVGNLPVNSLHKGPGRRKMSLFDDVILVYMIPAIFQETFSNTCQWKWAYIDSIVIEVTLYNPKLRYNNIGVNNEPKMT